MGVPIDSAAGVGYMSMSAHGARRLAGMNANLASRLGVELLCAARGIEFRAALRTNAPLRNVIERSRDEIPPPESDRPLTPDIERASRLVVIGALADATGATPLLDFGDNPRGNDP